MSHRSSYKHVYANIYRDRNINMGQKGKSMGIASGVCRSKRKRRERRSKKRTVVRHQRGEVGGRERKRREIWTDGSSVECVSN